MSPVKEALPFIESNLTNYGVDWINKGRVSDDFKFLIYGKPNHGKQFGIYNRNSTIIRLENYDQNIEGVVVRTKCAKTHTANADYSNFKKEKGVCVEVANTIALQKLLNWYFGT